MINIFQFDPSHHCVGDYWYHSHYDAQYCDGLRGALIVDDPKDPQKHLYDVDNGKHE
jgi:iron transport multicopper oxidase